jgi:hypothetical protein
MTAMAFDATKIARLIPLLSSDKDGEVLATVEAIKRLLKTGGNDWHDLPSALAGRGRSNPSSGGAKGDDYHELLLHPALNDWEREFMESICEQSSRWKNFKPSVKQEGILERLREKVRAAKNRSR